MIKKLRYLTKVENIATTHYLFEQDSKTILPIKSSQSLEINNLSVVNKYPEYEIKAIEIYKFLDNVYYTYLCLKRNKHKIQINYASSEAIEIAGILNLPIYINKTILDKQGIRVTTSLLMKSLSI